MNKFKLLDIYLTLFDGGAAEGAGGEGAGAAASGQDGTSTEKGGEKASPGRTHRGKSGEFQNVLFGKQESNPAGQPPKDGRGKEPEVITTSNTLEEKRKAYRDLVEGEYKDIYTEDTQRIINRRFRETQALQEQLGRAQPVIDMLMQRYKITDGDTAKLMAALEDDESYWEKRAEELGMSSEQAKRFDKLERDNAALIQAQRQQKGEQAAQQQLQRWYGEAEALRQQYPDFDLGAEVKNPQFLSMLKAGVPVQHAYQVIHMDDILAGERATQAKETEKQVVDSIRAKGMRPAENGISSQSAFTVKDDPSKWSKEDREEVACRVARGEKIQL